QHDSRPMHEQVQESFDRSRNHVTPPARHELDQIERPPAVTAPERLRQIEADLERDQRLRRQREMSPGQLPPPPEPIRFHRNWRVWFNPFLALPEPPPTTLPSE